MELIGKAKEEFEKWYLSEESRKRYNTKSLLLNDTALIVRFYSRSDTEKWVVYVYFFDSIGVDIGVYTGNSPHKIIKYVYVVEYNNELYEGVSNTIHQAREAAIKTAVEIYNNR